MLHIYLEYVRNHHYSLQCLVECKLSNPDFNKFLERCEMKAACEGLTLDILLVLPMNRVCFNIKNRNIYIYFIFIRFLII